MKRGEFPRVLILAPNAFNQHTGGGITLSNLFWEWPPGKIAQIHRDEMEPDMRVCQRFYKLGKAEMYKPWPLEQLRSVWNTVRSLATRSTSTQSSPDRIKSPMISSTAGKRLVSGIYQSFVGDGLPERVRISKALANFVSGFDPELIYTFLGSVPSMMLVREMLNRFPIPLVIHMMDDWPSVLYERGLFSRSMRLKLDPILRDLLSISAGRMAISDAMSRAFMERYQTRFVAFHNAVDLERWKKASRKNYASHDPFSIVYAGSVLPNAQLSSLADVAMAVEKLAISGSPVEMRIHSTLTDHNHRALLEKPPVVHIATPPDDHNLVGLLRGADLLVLPVNFDEISVRYVALSMPTKVAAYLASETPILVYGPAGVAQVEHAKSNNWGLVVSEAGVDRVAEAIMLVINNSELRSRLGKTGAIVAEQEFNAATIRPLFQQALRDAWKPGITA